MKIQVCMWKACKSRFAEYITKRLKADINFHNLEWVIVEECMCMGYCKEGPNVMFDKHIENHMNPIKASTMMMNIKNWKKENNKSKNNNKE